MWFFSAAAYSCRTQMHDCIFNCPSFDDHLGCSQFLLLQIVLQWATWYQLPYICTNTYVSISLGWIPRCEITESEGRSNGRGKGCCLICSARGLSQFLFPASVYGIRYTVCKRISFPTPLPTPDIRHSYLFPNKGVKKKMPPCFYLHFFQNRWD